MNPKENHKRNNKTFRKSLNNHLSFNQITKVEPSNFIIPQDILWKIEEDLDKGVFELVKYSNCPIRVSYEDENFDKQPPNVLTNNYLFNSQGNQHNLVVNNKKRIKSFFYLENGEKHEYFEINKERNIYQFQIDTIEQKDHIGNYKCKFCKETFKTKEGYINHRNTKSHIDNVTAVKNKHIDNNFTKKFYELHQKHNFDYVHLYIKPNNTNYYSNCEFQKVYYTGCPCCRLTSSSALTKGHGSKSSKKTKGRQKRERDLM